MYYVSTDALGSVNLLVRSTDGTRVADLGYDAWGRRRNPDTWTYSNITLSPLTDHGYTGHEMMDAFNLINMNGRAYDPVVAQFLSPDPFVQYPENPQSYNRYAYCLNNPLRYTDPSGYFSYEEFANQSLGWAKLAWNSWMSGGFASGYNRLAEQYMVDYSVCQDIEYKQWVGNWGSESVFSESTPLFQETKECNDQRPETFCGVPFDEAGHFFTREADAYLYMWKRDIVFKKENMCFVTDKGVLVLPCVNSMREEANNHNIDGSVNKNRPFYYNTVRVGKQLFVVPPRNIYNGILQVKAFVHTHGLINTSFFRNFSVVLFFSLIAVFYFLLIHKGKYKQIIMSKEKECGGKGKRSVIAVLFPLIGFLLFNLGWILKMLQNQGRF